MNKLKGFIAVCLLFLGACTSTGPPPTNTPKPAASIPPTVSISPPKACPPTLDDGVSPSYQPNAPERNIVGEGHILTGVVLSSLDCRPVAGARLEFWPEEAGKGHPDSSRATFYSDQNGRYRFECNPPEHIHMRISAEGYRTIGVNSYHPEGQAEGTFDIVLQPQ